MTELFPGVFRIDDHGAVNVYLVVGKDSALVIDTGMGNADLVSTVEKLTKKPLIVVNTHGHPDHTGANYQFKKIYIHPYDINDAVANNDPEKRRQAASVMQAGAKPTESELFKGKPEQTRLVPVRDGYIFRLGDRNLKVIETPGHTAGEIVILDIENKLLFAGDNDNTLVWLFLPDCKPLHEYLASLIKLQGMRNEFTTILPGHGIARSSDFIDDQVKCVKGILDGSLKTEPYKSFAGEAMMATFGKASVAFNPKNL
ncbi:MAG TPA: MBL fold metallo-hydrolase [Bacteroidales bacterium]|nr:MBL fold metallo-hydrolase [Bacteroidales bacterium]